jgi:hypothetical protein
LYPWPNQRLKKRMKMETIWFVRMAKPKARREPWIPPCLERQSASSPSLLLACVVLFDMVWTYQKQSEYGVSPGDADWWFAIYDLWSIPSASPCRSFYRHFWRRPGAARRAFNCCTSRPWPDRGSVVSFLKFEPDEWTCPLYGTACCTYMGQ